MRLYSGEIDIANIGKSIGTRENSLEKIIAFLNITTQKYRTCFRKRKRFWQQEIVDKLRHHCTIISESHPYKRPLPARLTSAGPFSFIFVAISSISVPSSLRLRFRLDLNFPSLRVAAILITPFGLSRWTFLQGFQEALFLAKAFPHSTFIDTTSGRSIPALATFTAVFLCI